MSKSVPVTLTREPLVQTADNDRYRSGECLISTSPCCVGGFVCWRSLLKRETDSGVLSFMYSTLVLFDSLVSPSRLLLLELTLAMSWPVRSWMATMVIRCCQEILIVMLI
ncbi:hypothetical protein KCV00_g182, partial [Aureobasidium melanogenum]